jgi:hypothetical protein
MPRPWPTALPVPPRNSICGVASVFSALGQRRAAEAGNCCVPPFVLSSKRRGMSIVGDIGLALLVVLCATGAVEFMIFRAGAD